PAATPTSTNATRGRASAGTQASVTSVDVTRRRGRRPSGASPANGVVVANVPETDPDDVRDGASAARPADDGRPSLRLAARAAGRCVPSRGAYVVVLMPKGSARGPSMMRGGRLRSDEMT